MLTRPGRTDGGATTIVMICHDEKRWSFLEAAVESAMAQPAAGVVLGVDHNDDLADAARRRWPALDVVVNRNRRGASSTRNAAAERVGTPLIAFLDDDVVARPGWLDTLSEAMTDPAVVGAGGVIEPIWASGSPPRWFPGEFGWAVGVSFTGQPRTTTPVRNVWGGNMVVRREVFESVGGFRESFTKVGDRARPEDTELCVRMAAAVPDGHWLYVPAARIGHQVPAERTTLRYFLTRSYQEGHGKIELGSIVDDDRSGEHDILADERSYMTDTLPRGVLSGVRDAVGGDPSGLLRVASIVGGAAAAGAGAAAAIVESRLPSRRPAATEDATADADAARTALAAHAPPIAVAELDLDTGASELPVGHGYRWARVLPRRGHAVGQPVLVPVHDGVVSADAVRGACGDWRPDPRLVEAPGAPSDLRLAVTVGTRDRPDQLRRMLESVARVDAEVQVLVVDNAPRDDRTRRVVEEMTLEDHRIRYLVEPRPGLSVARNRALLETEADVLLYTDDDVEIDRHWIEVHAAAFADPSVTVSTGQAFAARLDVRDELLSEVTVAWGKGSQPRRFSVADPPTDVPIFPFSPGLLGGGLNFAVRVDAARRLGGFDETLGAGGPMRGGEDCDFMIRAVRDGGVLQYSPNAFVWHHHRRDPGSFDAQRSDSAVGLGAYLGKLVTEPSALAGMVRRLPAGLRHFVRMRATAAAAGVDGEQRSSELVLTAKGALGYHRARRAVRRDGGHVADRPLGSWTRS